MVWQGEWQGGGLGGGGILYFIYFYCNLTEIILYFIVFLSFFHSFLFGNHLGDFLAEQWYINKLCNSNNCHILHSQQKCDVLNGYLLNGRGRTGAVGRAAVCRVPDVSKAVINQNTKTIQQTANNSTNCKHINTRA